MYQRVEEGMQKNVLEMEVKKPEVYPIFDSRCNIDKVT